MEIASWHFKTSLDQHMSWCPMYGAFKTNKQIASHYFVSGSRQGCGGWGWMTAYTSFVVCCWCAPDSTLIRKIGGQKKVESVKRLILLFLSLSCRCAVVLWQASRTLTRDDEEEEEGRGGERRHKSGVFQGGGGSGAARGWWSSSLWAEGRTAWFSLSRFQPDHYEGAQPMLDKVEEDQQRSPRPVQELDKGLLDLTATAESVA